MLTACTLKTYPPTAADLQYLVLLLLNEPHTALKTELDQFYRALNQASVNAINLSPQLTAPGEVEAMFFYDPRPVKLQSPS